MLRDQRIAEPDRIGRWTPSWNNWLAARCPNSAAGPSIDSYSDRLNCPRKSTPSWVCRIRHIFELSLGQITAGGLLQKFDFAIVDQEHVPPLSVVDHPPFFIGDLP